MLGKRNQGMKSRVATDRIRPMAPPPLHSMCEHSPPIESVVLGKHNREAVSNMIDLSVRPNRVKKRVSGSQEGVNK